MAKGGDCKSPALRLRRFESYLSHHPPSPRLRRDTSNGLKRRMPRCSFDEGGRSVRGCSSMVEQEFSKLKTRVRSPSPAPASAREARGGCHAVAQRAKAGWLPRASAWQADQSCCSVYPVMGASALFYVYMLQGIAQPEHYYVGLTSDLKERFAAHNRGDSSHTSKLLPWRLVTYVAFSDKAKAVSFERYLKSGSGRAFAKKHF